MKVMEVYENQEIYLYLIYHCEILFIILLTLEHIIHILIYVYEYVFVHVYDMYM